MFGMGVLDWLSHNWFTLLQSLGIVGGLFFTGTALMIDARVRRVGNSFEITKQHREIWSHLFSKPSLARVLDASADVARQPITQEEELFVQMLLLHLANAHQASNARMVVAPQGLQADVAAFFSLPIPNAVWQTNQIFQDSEFVEFVESLMKPAKISRR